MWYGNETGLIMFVLPCLYAGAEGGATQSAPSSAKRTFSSTSSEAQVLSQIPEMSVSSMDLASYVHQLRSHLPKASALIGGKLPDGRVPEKAKSEIDRETSSRSEGDAMQFMDRSITNRWYKQKPKVHVLNLLLAYS